MIQDSVKLTGELKLTVTNPEGNVTQEVVVPNLVVTAGKGYIASRMKDATATAMSHMAIGTGTSAAAVGDTTLGTEAGRVALTSTTVTANSVAYVATFGAGTGTYRLNSGVEFDDDFGPEGENYGTIAVGGTANGNIERTGDRDYFRATLETGRRYRIELEGSTANQGTLPDPLLTVRDSAGTVIASDDDSGGGRNSLLQFEPSASGEYLIDASGFGSKIRSLQFTSCGWKTEWCSTLHGR